MGTTFKSHLRRWTPDSVYYYYRAAKAPKLFAHEFNVLRPLLRSDRNAIDAGAHLGMFSRFFASIARQVYSFEPDPVIYQMLKRFAPAKVDARNYGLSDHSGAAVLATPVKDDAPVRGTGSVSAAAAPGEVAVQINLVRLDDQDLRDIQLMKVDVEGHELSVLKGGANLLKTSRPYLWMEIEQRFYQDKAIRDVFAEVESYGYNGFYFDSNDQKHSIREFDVEKHQNQTTYINNFLFEPVAGSK